MPGIEVKMGSYGDRERGPNLPQDKRYHSEDSLEDNQSSASSTESRQSDFQRKDHEFIPTRSSGILANKPAYNPGQFTRVNSNPLLISAQKQLLLVEEVRKKKKDLKVGEETPEWQSDLDSWKHRRRKQSEEALSRVSEIRRLEEQELENGLGKKKLSIGRKISLMIESDDVIDLNDLPAEENSVQRRSQEKDIPEEHEEQQEEEGEEDDMVTGYTSSHRESTTSQSTDISSDTSSSTITDVKKFYAEEPLKNEFPKNGINGAKLSIGSSTTRVSNSSSITSSSSSSNKISSSSFKSTSSSSFFKSADRENPYQTAIEGYKSFAQTHLSSSESSNDDWIEVVETEELVHTETKPEQPISESRTIPGKNKNKGGHKLPMEEKREEEDSSPPLSSLSSLSPSPPRNPAFTLNPSGLANPEGSLDVSNTSSKDEEWESKIESFVQPGRKSSTELSDKMRLKLASFEENNKSAKTADNISRVIQPDNTFRDKLKAFKNIETTTVAGLSAAAASSLSRRESEPVLPRILGAYKPYRSTSSSALMNTIQNNKFFQQNSLSSEGDDLLDDKLLSSEGDELLDDKLLDDALEESFSKLEEKNKPVFRAEDFIPSTERLAPPSEKPPPLPSVPPPELDEDSLREEDLAKQEREIIESLEREEREKKSKIETKLSSSPIKLPSLPLSADTSSQTPPTTQTIHHPPSSQQTASQTPPTTAQPIHHPPSSQQTASQTPPTNTQPIHHPSSSQQTEFIPSSQLHHSVEIQHSRSESHIQDDLLLAGSLEPTVVTNNIESRNLGARGAQGTGNILDSENQERKRGEGTNKDYSKHWLIQEAEQRRINDAQQQQQKVQKVERIENINNNTGMGTQNLNASKPNHVSENIYANIDTANITFNRTKSGYVPPLPGMQLPPEKGVSSQPPPPSSRVAGAHPGPAVPPRGGEGQDRVLSVSGKKKCSACKEELGRGAAMIIESLRLFYHIRCFKCCVCSVQLGNGEHGTDVRVRNNRLHCQNCYSNDEGLKFSKV